MHPCPTCACHVRSADAVCPHCGERIGGGGFARHHTVAAAILALSLAGCTGGTKSESGDTADSGTTTSVEPLYGVTVTESADTGATSGVDYGMSP